MKLKVIKTTSTFTRYSNRGCTVTSRNDQLLFAGGMKKKGFAWFQKLGLNNSYQTALKRNSEMAKDYDKKALDWKRAIEKEHHDMVMAGLDPSNKEDLKSYQKIHGRPSTYQVMFLTYS